MTKRNTVTARNIDGLTQAQENEIRNRAKLQNIMQILDAQGTVETTKKGNKNGFELLAGASQNLTGDMNAFNTFEITPIKDLAKKRESQNLALQDLRADGITGGAYDYLVGGLSKSDVKQKHEGKDNSVYETSTGERLTPYQAEKLTKENQERASIQKEAPDSRLTTSVQVAPGVWESKGLADPLQEYKKAQESFDTKKYKFDLLKKGGYQPGGEEHAYLQEKVALGLELNDDDLMIAGAIDPAFEQELRAYKDEFTKAKQKVRDIKLKEFMERSGETLRDANLIDKIRAGFAKTPTDTNVTTTSDFDRINQVYDEKVQPDKDLTDKLNLAWRLEQAGIPQDEIMKALDDRNFVEKALNLSPTSGVIGGTLDLVGRVGGIVPAVLEGASDYHRAQQSGDSLHYGALTARELEQMTPEQVAEYERTVREQNQGQGLLGSIGNALTNNFTGADIGDTSQALQNWTQNEQYFKDRDAGLRGADWTDALGLVGDLVLDPTNYVMLPGTKITSAVDKTADALKLADTASDVVNTSVKGVQKADKIKDATSKIDDVIKALNSRNIKKYSSAKEAKAILENAKKSGSLGEMSHALQSTKEALETQAKFLSEAVEKGGRKAKYSTAFEKLADVGGNFVEKTADQVFNSKTFKNFSDKVVGTVNATLANAENGGSVSQSVAKFIKGTTEAVKGVMFSDNSKIMETVLANGHKRDVIAQKTAPLFQDFANEAVNLFKKGDLPEFESLEDLSRALNQTRELRGGVVEEMRVGDLVNKLRRKENVIIPYSVEAEDAFKTLLKGTKGAKERLVLHQSTSGKQFFVLEGKHFTESMLNRMGSIKQSGGTVSRLDDMINLGSGMSPEEFNKVLEYANNPYFKDLADKFDETMFGVQRVAGQELFGDETAFTKLGAGYVPHTTSEAGRDLRKMSYEANAEELNHVMASDKFQGDETVQNLNSRFRDRKTNYPASVKNEIKKFELERFQKSEAFAETFPDKEAQEAFKELASKDFFNDEALGSIADFLTGRVQPLSEIKGRADAIESIMKLGSDANTDFGLSILPKNGVAPAGQTLLTPEQAKALYKDFDALLDFSQNVSPSLDRFSRNLRKVIDGKAQMGVTHEALHLLTDVSTKFHNDNIQSLIDGFDTVTRLFKGNAITSPGYLPRNEFQNFTNQIVAGLPIKDTLATHKNIAKYHTELFDGVNGNTSLIDLVKTGKADTITDPVKRELAEAAFELQSKGIIGTAQFEITKSGSSVREAVRNGFEDLQDFKISETRQKINKSTEHMLKTPISAIKDTAFKLNSSRDDAYRISSYIQAKKNPQIMAKMGIDNPADFVRLVHFDGTALSSFEQDVMKRVFPFYTIAKQNFMFHLKNVLTDPTKYKQMETVRRNLWDMVGVEQSMLADYEKENSPFPGVSTIASSFMGNPVGPDGDYNMMSGETSYADAINAFKPSSTGKGIMDSLNPLIKLPFELVGNQSLFSGKEVYNEDENALERTKDAGIYAIENALGLSSIKNSSTRFLDMLIEAHKNGEISLEDVGKGLSLETSGNLDKNDSYRQKEATARLQALAKKYKTQGVEIPTLKELEKAKRR